VGHLSAAAGIQPRESTLAAADGTPLFVRDWPLAAAASRRGGLVLMHGLGEHCGRHARVARFFNACGYAVRSYDHRGHGRSGGARGDVPDSAAIVNDAKLVLDDFVRQGDTASAAGPAPLLFGHSMGGLFAARFASARLAPLRGLILSSPALALPLSARQKILLKILGAVAPGLAVPNGLQARYLSHDPAVEPAYAADPLVHRKISARLLRAMLEAIGWVQAHAAALSIPTLMLVAGDDRLVAAGGSRAFFSRLAAGVGTLRVYDDFYHEIFNERGAAQVFDDTRAWLALHG
jgi:alpha-beta hydrolase superfamily lysophospholipase